MVKRKAAQVQEPRKRRRTALEGPKDDRNLNMQKEMEPATTKGPSEAANSSLKPLTFANGVNPLHIDHILEKVLHYAIMPTATQKERKTDADHETARSIRLVSRRWKETATPIYRKARGPLNFLSGDGIEMQSFLNTMKNSSLIPVEKYAIGGNFMVQKNEQLLKDFMRICGPSATELQLTYGIRFGNTMDFSRTMFPNLNLLKLHSLRIHGDYSGVKFKLADDIDKIRKEIEVLQGAVDNLREFQNLVEVLRGAARNLREFFYEKQYFAEVAGLSLSVIRVVSDTLREWEEIHDNRSMSQPSH